MMAGSFLAHKYVRGITSLSVSPDGNSLVTSGNSSGVMMDRSVKLWSRAIRGADVVWEERPISGSEHSQVITAVAFSPDNTHFLSCSMDKKVFVYDAESGEQIMSLTGHGDKVYCACFKHGSQQVVSGSHDKSVKIWALSGAEETTKQSIVKRASHQGQSSLAALGAFGTAAPSSTDARMDRRRKSLLSQAMPLSALQGSRQRRQTMKPAVVPLLEDEESLSPIAASVTRDQTRVLSGSHADSVTASVVSVDGQVAITGSADKTLKVWDVSDDGRDTLTLLGHNAAITALHMTPCRRLFVSGDADGNLLMWNGMNFDHYHTVHAHPGTSITCITVVDVVRIPPGTKPPTASTGLIVLSGGQDGSLKAWKALDGRPWEVTPPPELHLPSTSILSMSFTAAATLPLPPQARPAPLNSGLLQPHHIDTMATVTPKAGMPPPRGLPPLPDAGVPPSPTAVPSSTRSARAFSFGGSSERQGPCIPGGTPQPVPSDMYPPHALIEGLAQQDGEPRSNTVNVEDVAAAAAAAADKGVTPLSPTAASLEASLPLVPLGGLDAEGEQGLQPANQILSTVFSGGASGLSSHCAVGDTAAHSALRELYPAVTQKLPLDAVEGTYGSVLPSIESADPSAGAARGKGVDTPSASRRRSSRTQRRAKEEAISERAALKCIGPLLVEQAVVASQPGGWDDPRLSGAGDDPIASVPGWTPPRRAGKGDGTGGATAAARAALAVLEGGVDRITSLSDDGRMVTWDLFRGTTVAVVDIPLKHTGRCIRSAALAPHAARVAVAAWDLDVTTRAAVGPCGNPELMVPLPLDTLSAMEAFAEEGGAEELDDDELDATSVALAATSRTAGDYSLGGAGDLASLGVPSLVAGGLPVTADALEREVRRVAQERKSRAKAGLSEDSKKHGIVGAPLGPQSPLLRDNGGMVAFQRQAKRRQRASMANRFGRYTATSEEEALAATEQARAKELKRYEDKKRRRAEREARRAARRASRQRRGDDDEDEDDEDDEDEDSEDSETDRAGAPAEEAEADWDEDSPVQDLDPAEWHEVTAMGFSADGSLLVSGTRDRLVTISDPARPHLGPLAQFLTTASVTTIGMGPGALPWAEPATGSGGPAPSPESKDGDSIPQQPPSSMGAHSESGAGRGRPALVPSSTRSSASAPPLLTPGSGGVAGSMLQQFRELSTRPPDMGELMAAGPHVPGLQALTGTILSHSLNHAKRVVAATPREVSTPMSSGGVRDAGHRMDAEANKAVFDSMRSLTEHSLRMQRMGDGQGTLGVVVVGDSTGQVFILKLKDTLRAAEGARDTAATSAALDRVAAAHKDALAQEISQVSEVGEEVEEEEGGEAVPPDVRMARSTPISRVFFDTGRSAEVVRLPRALHRDTQDELLVEWALKRLGVQVDELSAQPIPITHSKELLAALPIRGQDLGQGLEALYPKLGITAPEGEEADAGLLSIARRLEADARREGTYLLPPPSPTRDRVSGPGGQRRPGAPGRRPAPREPRPAPPPPTEAALRAALEVDPAAQKFSAFGRGVERKPGEVFAAGPLRLQALRQKYFSCPRALVCVFGGAGGLHDLLVPRLRGLVKKGATVAAVAAGGMVLDGGTDAGVMSMIGQGLEGVHPSALRVLGVCPGGLVTYPRRSKPLSKRRLLRQLHGEGDSTPKSVSPSGAASAGRRGGGRGSRRRLRAGSDRDGVGSASPSAASTPKAEESSSDSDEEEEDAAAVGSDKAPLEPHHSNFFLTPTSEWGGETTTMFTVACVLRRRLPTVAVLANGGFISQQEIRTCVQLGIPVIVIEGSGRLADKIAQAVTDRSTAEPGAWDPERDVPDAGVREIIEGDITLFSVASPPSALQDVILEKLLLQQATMHKPSSKAVVVQAPPAAGSGSVTKAAPAAPRRKPPAQLQLPDGSNLD